MLKIIEATSTIKTKYFGNVKHKLPNYSSKIFMAFSGNITEKIKEYQVNLNTQYDCMMIIRKNIYICYFTVKKLAIYYNDKMEKSK